LVGLKTYPDYSANALLVLLVANRSLRVGLVQLEVTASKTENLAHIIRSLEEIGKDCDLVVFPEYSMGYPKNKLTRDYLESLAEPLDGEFVGSVAEVSKEKQIAVVLPMHEKATASIFNTAVIIDRGKVLGGYRKIHLFDAFGFRESDFFGSGSELILANVAGTTFGVITCYDLRFPELVKKESMSGATVIIVPAAWFRGPLKEEQWQTYLMARAAENTSFVVGVGNANENFVGRSIVANPFGVKVLDLGYGSRIGRYDIDNDLIARARETIPVLQQSRNTTDIQCRRL